MKSRKPSEGDVRCMVALWLGDFIYPMDELNTLIAILASGGNPHVHLIAATRLKFLKNVMTCITT